MTAPQLTVDSHSTLPTANASIFIMLAARGPIAKITKSPEPATRRNAPHAHSGSREIATRNRERGAGHLKAIVFTLILLSLIYAGFKVVPYMVNEYEFQDGIQEIARYASAMRQDTGKVREAVLKEAQKDDVPISTEDIKVEGTSGNYQISADYSVTVDLKVYQWTLNFHPSVSNKALF